MSTQKTFEQQKKTAMRQEKTKVRKKKAKRLYTLIVFVLIALIGISAAVFIRSLGQPSINIIGSEDLSIGLYGTYNEKGAKAVFKEKDITSEIKIKSDLDTSKPGTYKITYVCRNAEKTRTVKVGEKMDPVLKLKGPLNVTIGLGEVYSEAGYEAFDEKGNDITEDVKVTETGFMKTGKHELEYTVSDGLGNSTTRKRVFTVTKNTGYETTGLPIMMFHHVYDPDDPPYDLQARYQNYISKDLLEEMLGYLNENDYYFPTWKEVRDYTEGKIMLPEKSVVMTFDDGELDSLRYIAPALEKHRIPATVFIITKNSGKKKVELYGSEYVSFQSHSHNMHRAGGMIGKGGVFTALPEKDALEDLKTSVDICKSEDAFAYPYGDYTENCRNILQKAGFICAVTTEGGRVFPGRDALLLPRTRVIGGQDLYQFIGSVSPGEPVMAGSWEAYYPDEIKQNEVYEQNAGNERNDGTSGQ